MTNEEIHKKLENIYEILIKELNKEYRNNIRLLNISIKDDKDPHNTVFIAHTVIDSTHLDILNSDFAACMKYDEFKSEVINYMKSHGVNFKEKTKLNVYHKILKHNRSKEK